MKLTVDRDTLARATADVARATPTKPTTPILAGMRIHAHDQLTLTAYDYDTSIRATTAADIADTGTTLAPGRRLAAIAADLPPGDIHITLDGDTLRLHAPGVTYALPTIDPDNYPTIPDPPPTTGTVDAAQLATTLARAAVSARDTDRGPFTSVLHIEADEDGITAVATDTYTLTRYHCPWTTPPDENVAALELPAKTLLAAVKNTTGTLELGVGDNHVSITTPNRTTTLRRLAIEYPNWRHIIDTRPADQTTATLDQTPLAEALDRCTGVRQAPDDATTLDIGDGHIDYHSAALDLASVTGTIDAQTTGPTVTTQVNPVYLLDAVRALDGPITLGLTGGRKPIHVTGSGDGLHLVMPIVKPRT